MAKLVVAIGFRGASGETAREHSNWQQWNAKPEGIWSTEDAALLRLGECGSESAECAARYGQLGN